MNAVYLPEEKQIDSATVPCPECGGDARTIQPYRLGWKGLYWTELYLCRVCCNRGTVAPRIARLYAARKLPLPLLYEAWIKRRKERVK